VFVGGDIMQVEAAIACSAAVLELFVQNVRGRVRLFRGIPETVPQCRFEDVWAEGGFRISGEKQAGTVTRVTVTSTRGGMIRLENPWPGEAAVVVSIAESKQAALVESADPILQFDTEVSGVYEIHREGI
jgi:hypothetical protein